MQGYSSKNGIIIFPSNGIYDKSPSISDRYTVIFNYQNNTNQPVEINLFNSFVTIKGTKYNLGFKTGRDGQDIIDWTFYSNGHESNGVFVGPEGSKLSKLRFNPGQRLYGEFEFKIPGKTKFFEKDIDGFVFQLDGIQCDEFKKVSYYEVSKSEAIITINGTQNRLKKRASRR